MDKIGARLDKNDEWLTYATAQYAVEHNAAMQNATLDVKKAEADRWKTLSSMLPSVKAGFDYQNMLGYEMKMGSGLMSI